MAAKPQAQVRPSNPEYTRTVQLRTFPAQKVLHRAFQRTVNSLFRTDVVLRAQGATEEIDQIDQAVDEILSTVSAELAKERDRLETLREKHGIDFTPEYTSPVEHPIRIPSPHVAGYLSRILELDEVAVLIDSLWLSGVLDNHQRQHAYYQWERRTERAGRKIIELERRARKSSRRESRKADKPNGQTSASNSPAQGHDEESAPATASASAEDVTAMSGKDAAADAL